MFLHISFNNDNTVNAYCLSDHVVRRQHIPEGFGAYVRSFTPITSLADWIPLNRWYKCNRTRPPVDFLPGRGDHHV